MSAQVAAVANLGQPVVCLNLQNQANVDMCKCVIPRTQVHVSHLLPCFVYSCTSLQAKKQMGSRAGRGHNYNSQPVNYGNMQLGLIYCMHVLPE
jgi:hypothetical protein